MSSRSSSLGLAVAAAALVACVGALLWSIGGDRSPSAIERGASSGAVPSTGDESALAALAREASVAPAIASLPLEDSRRASVAKEDAGSPSAPRATPKPPRIPFHGRVVDRATGAAVAGALVEVFANGGGAQDEETTTDASGRFHFERSSWWWFYVRVTARGYATGYAVTDGVHRDAAQPLAIDLAPAASLVVRVRDAGNSIAAAHVVVATSAPELRQRQLVGEPVVKVERAPFAATTDVHGVARFDGLPSGEDLMIVASRDATSSLFHRVVLAAREVREITLDAVAHPLVRIRVVDASDLALAGMHVTLSPVDRSPPTWSPYESSELSTLTSEVAELLAVGADRAQIDETLAAIRKARGSVGPVVQTTSADGTCAFENVPPGRYQVEVRPPQDDASSARSRSRLDVSHLGHAARSLELERFSWAPGRPVAVSDVEVADVERVVVVRVERPLTIRGRVVVPPELERGGISIQATRGNRWSVESTQTRDDGTFELAGLLPGRWTLRAMPTPSTRGSRDVEVEAGATDVELELFRPSFVRLRIVDAISGTTLAGKILAFDDASPTPTDMRTSVGGVIAAAELAPGPHTFVATTDDGRIGALAAHLAPGSSEIPLDVVVARGGNAALLLLGPDASARIEVVDGSRVLARASVVASRSTDLLLPVGRCTVRALRSDGALLDARDVVIEAGRTSSVVLGAPRAR